MVDSSTQKHASQRDQGTIEILPSGSLRVSVYAGLNPLSRKRHYLKETIEVAPNPSKKQLREAWKRAEATRDDFLALVRQKKQPLTNATVGDLIDRYYDPEQTNLRIGETTRDMETRRARLHIRPLLGHVRLADLDEEVFDMFYAELERCQDHCSKKPTIDHRTTARHECDERCRTHECEPLSASTIRNIHSIMSKMLAKAVRWKWIAVNPISKAESPKTPVAKPKPPTPREMAALLNEAWRDPDWGMLVWTACRTGARRGEVSAATLDVLDLTDGYLGIEKSIAQIRGKKWEKPTKTDRTRRVALADIDVQLFEAYLRYRFTKATELGIQIQPTGRIFSLSPDHSTWIDPDTITQRFGHMCKRLGINSSFQKLRQFSASELLASGVDIRTAAGRLGHSGGGATTLKVYAAFVDEANRRAAEATAQRMTDYVPDPVAALISGIEPAAIPDEPTEPYQHIARDLAGAIRSGLAEPGQTLPTMATLAKRYDVVPSTVHRAVKLLADDGLVTTGRGKPTTVADGAADEDNHEEGPTQR